MFYYGKNDKNSLVYKRGKNILGFVVKDKKCISKL